MSHLPRLRTLWLTVHRWLALALLVLLVPIAISGALLVWHDELDALIHPGRYAVTGAQVVAALGIPGERSRGVGRGQRRPAGGGALSRR